MAGNNNPVALPTYPETGIPFREKFMAFLIGGSILLILISCMGIIPLISAYAFLAGLALLAIGTSVYYIFYYGRLKPGVRNDYIFMRSLTSRGFWGYVLGIFLTGFYILLYWYPEYLLHIVSLFNPLSFVLSGGPADSWFLYGTLYTLATLTMGIRAIAKYRHSRYQIMRTSVIIFVQISFAYLIPSLMKLMHQPEFYFSYFWPLKPEYLFPSTVTQLKNHPGGIGFFLVLWSGMLAFIATPILTYFFGKRWYCSWVCGCGGLANTLGDPWRQLSNKSDKAWQIEKGMIYSVLGLVIILTALLWINSYKQGQLLGKISLLYAKWYGFFIGAVFSGVIGVGFYPILGTRVWCRFGCPMAAYLGILQVFFSRFRITTNKGQCISCGNCSTYCEMGIDVRAYAQQGKDIIRASCVGCGICATVCPRGVLKLENK